LLTTKENSLVIVARFNLSEVTQLPGRAPIGLAWEEVIPGRRRATRPTLGVGWLRSWRQDEAFDSVGKALILVGPRHPPGGSLDLNVGVSHRDAQA